ncbi:MAG: ABC transporter ATP-binding protein [Holosporales bacterium]|jgi:lipoprotein-releasing system ATP-binding protein|nr:ABC transporter ATP-binding protein [Holosporales bacterium]
MLRFKNHLAKVSNTEGANISGTSEILRLQDVSMDFKSGESLVHVLQNFCAVIHVSEKVALVGSSGTGKSTILQISALLEQPTSGSVFVDGKRASSLSDDEKAKIRRDNIGFVYQSHNLLPEFSALENVIIPQLIKKVPRKDAEVRAENLLCSVGLEHRLHHKPAQLSGGERQRVAIARALVNEPNIIIADEPTGSLDPETADIVFDLFLNLANNFRVSIFMATHNLCLAERMDRIISTEGKA